MTDDTDRPIVAVSDVHLGTAHIEGITPPDRGRFEEFLREFPDVLGSVLGTTPGHLVLNGDVDDLWRRNVRTLTRENYDIYGLLADLRERGIEVHYVLGNHDWYARRDREGAGGRSGVSYYDTDYEERVRLATNGTNYTFVHGYQFDRLILGFARAMGFSPPEDVFDVLAEFDGDVYGNGQERLWNRIRRFGEYRYDFSRFRSLLEQVDVDGGERKRDLGVAPRGAMRSARRDPDTDWLCIGHTHVGGIEPDPSVENGGVANSGAWKGAEDSFLVLEATPGLWSWNDDDPVRLET